MNTQLRNAAEATANWWAEKMQAPNNWNNGDDTPTGGMAFLLGNMLSRSAQKSISDENIELFKTALVTYIEDKYNAGEKYKASIMDVDYDPCEGLYIACKAAGINPSALPVKSTSRIEPDFSVNASYQYRGEWKPIYKPEEITA